MKPVVFKDKSSLKQALRRRLVRWVPAMKEARDGGSAVLAGKGAHTREECRRFVRA
jgi:hypothetical protein